MAILTTTLREFLIDVLHSDVSMKELFGDSFFYDYFDFYDVTYDAPNEKEITRVKTVCGVTNPEEIEAIWEQAVSTHYERSYLDEYHDEMLKEIEKGVKQSFENLTEFFRDELEDAGLSVETLTPFKVQLNWEDDQLTIEGDLTALEVILNEVMRGVGWMYYDSLEDFIACNGEDQIKRITSHLHYLKSIEPVYGSSYNFFTVNGLSELDYYRTFGDYNVTDEELKEAMCA